MESRPIKILFLLLLTSFILAGSSMAQNGIKEDLFEGFIYYSDKQKISLKSVKKRFASSLNSYLLGREIVKTLLEGPSLSSLEPTWPKDVTLNSFFISYDGKAFVDLNVQPEMVEQMDVHSELLAVYSMVNSLTLNIPKIKMVKILIQGNDAVTLAGHIDLEYFYKTNMLIVK